MRAPYIGPGADEIMSQHFVASTTRPCAERVRGRASDAFYAVDIDGWRENKNKYLSLTEID